MFNVIGIFREEKSMCKKIEITKERLKQLEGYESIIQVMKENGFNTFKSVKEFLQEHKWLEEENKKLEQDLKHKKIAIQNRKVRIKDLEKQIDELKEKADKVVISLKADCNEIGKRAYDLEKQIEKMKCCFNCKHSRTEYEHCKTDKHEKWELAE